MGNHSSYAPDDDVKGCLKTFYEEKTFKGARQATGIVKLNS
ncbi:MAG: hypothetical protein AAF630_01710 [Cyanobacteria bacterium P01_C01_bin.38]